jgi:hypothetical protein
MPASSNQAQSRTENVPPAIVVAWPTLVGADVANATEPLDLQGDVLVVCTEASQWSHQLAFLERDIVKGLAQYGVARLRFRVAPRQTNALRIDACRRLDTAYTYVGVYAHAPEDPNGVDRLRLLYDLREHTDDDGSPIHWAGFAARINDNWSSKGGYNIVAFKTLDGLRETLTSAEMAALPLESDQPDPLPAWPS